MAPRVADAHAYLVRKGHIDPVVAVSTREGRVDAGDTRLPAEIGSVTKVFTSLLLADLVLAGTVRFDERIPAFLPPGTPTAPKVSDITLEQLACHRSGLPRLPPGILAHSFSRTAMVDPYADLDADRLIASLSRTRVHGTPGEAPVRYSNYGMGLLGLLLGRATGLGYEEALARRILQPLDLAGTSFADAPLRQGHHGGKPVAPWHLAALAGAGGLHSPAGDVLTFLEAVRDGSGPLAGAIAETLRPRADRGRPGVGLGWFMLADGDLLMHDGGTLGARAEVRVERHSGTAIVVLGDARRGTPRAAAMLLNPRR